MVVLKLALALVVLVWSGGLLASALSRLSSRLQVSSFVISFVLMAAATSVPELFVGIASALEGRGILAYGTVVGSNIANIALILGVLLLLNGTLRMDSVIQRREAVWAASLACLPFIVGLDGSVSRVDGGVLLLAFVAYMAQLLRSSRFFHKIGQAGTNPAFWAELGKFAAGVAFLLVASHYTVRYAVELAEAAGVPVFVVGTFLVALGTSLPELVFALRSTSAGDPLLSVGDLTGSVVFNATAILGVSALIRPFPVPEQAQYVLSGVFLLLVMLYFASAVFQRRLLSRTWGVILVVFYAAFVALAWGLEHGS